MTAGDYSPYFGLGMVGVVPPYPATYWPTTTVYGLPAGGNGWECPRCHQIWAYWVSKCDCKPPEVVIAPEPKRVIMERYEFNRYLRDQGVCVRTANIFTRAGGEFFDFDNVDLEKFKDVLRQGYHWCQFNNCRNFGRKAFDELCDKLLSPSNNLP